MIGFAVGLTVANVMIIALFCTPKAKPSDRLLMFVIGLCGVALSVLSAMRAP